MTTTAYSHLADAQASEFERSALFLDLKNRTHEHLLSRIEELGAEFGRWSQAAIAQFVLMELDSFIRLHSVPVNEQEALQVARALRSEEHTSELQSPCNIVCRLLLEKKKNNNHYQL